MTDPLLKSIQDVVLQKTNQNLVLINGENAELLKDEVKGYDFNNGINYSELLKSFSKIGFQATNFSLAIKQIEEMVKDIFNIYLFVIDKFFF